MLERVQSLADAERLPDVMKVAFPNGLAIGLAVANINQLLSLVSLSLTIAYTIWRWRKSARRDKE